MSASTHHANDAVIDAQRLEQLVEPRTLAALYARYLGTPLVGAHGALADVEAAAAVVAAQMQRHAQLPHTPAALHALSWPDVIDPDGKFVWRGDTPVVNFGKLKGSMRVMRSLAVPSRQKPCPA